MTQRFFRHKTTGKYLGSYDGPDAEIPFPKASRVEIAEPPAHGLMAWDGVAWIDTPASLATMQAEPDLRAIADALTAKGILTRGETGR